MPTPIETISSNRIPASTVRRWALKAGILGFFAGLAIGIVALLN